MKTKASYHQERLWFIDKFENGVLYEASPIYHNIPLILNIAGHLDIERVEHSIQEVINRHEALRTRIITESDTPYQEIEETVDFSLPVSDMTGDGYENAMSCAEEEIRQPFKIQEAPLLRARLIKYGRNRYILVATVHHIVADRRSMGILLEEIFLNYRESLNDTSPRLPELSLHYADFSQWQHNLPPKLNDSLLSYWKKKLAGKLQALEIPTDRPRVLIHTYRAGRQPFSIPKKLYHPLKSFGKQTGNSDFVTFLTTFKVLLYRYTGHDEIVVGISAENRNQPGLENMIGPCANLLVTRDDISGKQSFNSFAAAQANTVNEAKKHQFMPFDKLVLDINPEKDMSRTAFFDVLFQYQDSPMPVPSVDNLEIDVVESNLGWGKYDLNLQVWDNGDSFSGILVYNTDYYNGSTISRMIGHYSQLLEEFLHSPDKNISALPIITGQEKDQLLHEWNQGNADYPENKTIHQLFKEQVARTPGNIAVNEPGGISYTYRQLDDKSDRLAAVLIKKGVKPDTIVGFMMDRTVDVIVAMLGILKAGGAYLPIDPEYPRERIDYMLTDSDVNIVLVDSMTTPPAVNGVEAVLIHEAVEQGEALTLTYPTVTPANLAYVIYTSGTTGKPKGVLLEHKNVVRLMTNDKFQFDFSSNDVWTMFHSFCFDFSVWEMYGALLYGGKLVVIPRMIARDTQKFLNVLKTEGVTVLNQTPSAFYSLVDRHLNASNDNFEDRKLGIRYVIFGGEALTPSKLKEWRAAYPGTKLINMYGITETTVHVTFKEITGKDIDANISNIGTPIPTLTTYVLNNEFILQPIGVPGECCVGGDGVGRGYLNRPELTAEKFIESPYKPGEKLYRSGDLIKMNENGELEYLGRIDRQVKIRGFRIELGEIESKLITHEGINQAVVTINEDNAGDKFLAAYYVSQTELEIADMRDHLLKSLPGYMVPSYFMPLDKIPLTSNGKLDRKALPRPGVRTDNVSTAPTSDVEKKLAAIWTEVLDLQGSSTIGIDDNFFELGGHSLKGVILVSRVHKELNVKIPLSEVFRLPTIRELAQYIENSSSESYANIESVEQKEYYPLSSGQQRVFFIQRMYPDNTAYNSYHISLLKEKPDVEQIAGIFNQLMHRHESLRTSFIEFDGVPVQRIHDASDMEISINNYKTTRENIPQCIEKSLTPFDLAAPPLLRLTFIDVEEDYYIMLVGLHHIISDGVSGDVLINDFQALYDDRELPPLKLRYIDYVQWQNSGNNDNVTNSQRDYWLNVFSGEVPALKLPTDYPRPVVKSFDGDFVDFRLESGQVDVLKKYALEQGATLYMVLLSAYYILLAKLSSQQDIVIGSPEAGRRHPDLEKIVGLFINTITLRCFPEKEKPFPEFLNDVKNRTLEAFENQNYQFEDLVERLNLNRDTGRNPLFDVMFDYHNEREHRAADTGSIFDSDLEMPDYKKGTSMFDLNLHVNETPDDVFFSLDFCTKIFKKESVQKFVSYYKRIVEDVIHNSHKTLSQIELLPEEEKHRILYQFNDTRESNVRDTLMHTLFEEQVERTPGNIAVSFDGKEITYKDLNTEANRLAGKLRASGAAPGFVSVVIDRNIEMVVAVMAILKAGGAYVPLEPVLPTARIVDILQSLGVNNILTNRMQLEKTTEIAGQLPGTAQVFCLDANREDADDAAVRDNVSPDNVSIVSREEWLSLPGHNPVPLTEPSDIAYIIYTSGSTGVPKGVVLEHSPVVNLIQWVNNTFHVAAPDKLLGVASLSFDLSVYDIFGILATGAELRVVSRGDIKNPERLLDIILTEEITFWDSAPAALQQITPCFPDVENHPNESKLRLVFLSGDWIPVPLPDLLRDTFKGVQVISLGGATEAAIWSNFYPIGNVDPAWKSIPYGKPIRNAKYYILDESMNVCPTGVAGDLYIGGDCLASGYINDIKLSSSRFIPNPYVPSEKIYKTGDVARYFEDGNMEFLGRVDNQVKLRGLRIELGEIETRLLTHPEIAEAIVVIHGKTLEDKYLCAYIVPANNEAPPADELRLHLEEKLPDYMTPSYFVTLEKMPLSPNGKVNRKALPEPDRVSSGSADQYIAPRDEMETRLASIWAEILKIEKENIGIDADFFEIGGNSLKSIVLISNIHKYLHVKFPLVDLFANAKLEKMAEYIKNSQKDNYTSLQPVEKKDYYPLSSAQQRLYILHQLDAHSVNHNMSFVLQLNGRFDKDKMERAFKALIKRHESFRTSFELVREKPFQMIHQDVPFKIDYIDCSGYQDKERIEEIITNFVRPFKLEQAPLLRAGIIKVDDREHVLMIDIHHIISDGTSIITFVKECAALYNGESLPVLNLQYKDYSEWHNSEKEKENINKQAAYWLNEFEGEIPVLNLPTDYERPAVQGFEGNSLGFNIDRDTYEPLKALALEHEATVYMVVLAVFNIMLSKLSGQDQIIVGAPTSGRRHADLQQVMGMFLNTLTIRNHLDGEQTFAEFLKAVKFKTLKAIENQDYQFEDLVENVSVARDVSRNPLFDVMFNLNNIDAGTGELTGIDVPGLTLTPYEREKKESNFDLTLIGTEEANDIRLAFEYSTRLFKKETIERFITYFNRLMADILKNPGKKIKEVSLITPREKDQVLFQFNPSKTEVPVKNYAQLFEEQAAKTPDKIAAIYDGRYITYKKLNQDANALAHYLMEKGVTRGSMVPLYLHRSTAMLVSILAIFKAGGAYVPIEVDYPPDRVEFIIEDSESTVAITQAAYLDTVNHIRESSTGLKEIICIDNPREIGQIINNYPSTNPGKDSNISDLAYMIYTSGTTGKPKGVMIHQQGMNNHLYAKINDLSLTQDDIIAQTASACFDISVWQFLAGLLVGGTTLIIPKEIVLNPPAFLRVLQQERVSILESVPSLMTAFLETAGSSGDKELDHLRWMIPTGEPLTPPLVKVWNRYYPRIPLVNAYGPTEASDDITHYVVDELPDDTQATISIGKPLQNLHIYILDKDLALCPAGVRGEICVAGIGVGKGYWKDTEKTQRHFIPNPFLDEIGDRDYARLYKTGDIGYFRDDGNIECLGRLDFQVKIRGNRIELGEIERQLLEHDDITDAVVVAKDDDNGEKYLCAYFVSSTYNSLNTGELRDYLAGKIPGYMVPAYFMNLEKMPLTNAGKIDRKSLPQIDKSHISTEREYRPPRNELEETIAQIWQDILGIEAVGIDDNYFNLGGDSIKAIRISARLKKFSLKLELADLFRYPTIEELSSYVTPIGDEPEPVVNDQEAAVDMEEAEMVFDILNEIEIDL